MSDIVHVVAAVVFDESGRVLIAKRSSDKHQGGKWEFPGGKVDAGETAQQALTRELEEEIGIQLTASQALINIRHDYSDKSIFIDVFSVSDFTGTAYGKEGQPIAWVNVDELKSYEFPEANAAIITAINLPDVCLITPEPRHEIDFLGKLESSLRSGIRLVQFRAKELSNSDYMDLARSVIPLVHQYEAKILLNSPPLWMKEADGMHLSSEILENTPYRPSLGANKLVTVACHNQAEIEKASHIRADALFISPINKTVSHPAAKPLGWSAFKSLADQANVPVYALGGMGFEDVDQAKINGGQGIAAISAIWNRGA